MDTYQAIAYMVLALKEKGYSVKEIQEIRGAMLYFMDMKTEEEAEEQADKILQQND